MSVETNSHQASSGLNTYNVTIIIREHRAPNDLPMHNHPPTLDINQPLLLFPRGRTEFGRPYSAHPVSRFDLRLAPVQPYRSDHHGCMHISKLALGTHTFVSH